MRVICLCCGSEYPPDADCPNVDDNEHSVERASAVAEYLRDRGGCNHPRPLDVWTALSALDALASS